MHQQPRWQEAFETLRQTFERELQAEKERFTNTQDDYRRFLASKYPDLRLWAEITFNPAEPQDSYTRLWDGVHDVLKQAVEVARKQVLTLYDRAARLHGGSLVNLPPAERPSAQAKLDDLLTTLSKHQEITNKWAEQVTAPAFMDRVRERGATTPAEIMLNPVVTRITALTREVPDLDRHLSAIEQKVLAAKLTAEEEGMLAELIALQQSNGQHPEIELGLLLQNAANQQAHWDLIASLYAKQRLRIKIAPVVFDEVPF